MTTASNKFQFTKTALAKIEPTTTRATYWDTQTAGLVVRVTPAGTKTFYVIRRVGGMGRKGTAEYIRIGAFPDMTVEQARTAARNSLKLLNSGESVRAAATAKKDELTVGDLWKLWTTERSVGPNPDKPIKRSWKKDQRLYDCHLKDRANRRVSEVTSTLVGKIFRDVTVNSGPVEANHLKRLARAIWNHAIKHHGLNTRNPWTTITDNREAPREQWVKPDQMPALFKAIDSINNEDAADIFRLCLFTGARSGNVKAMRWDQVDLKANVWTIGSAHHKNKRVHSIPLPPPAVAILKRRVGVSAEWVFPSSSTAGHVTNIYASWKEVLKAFAAEVGSSEAPDIRIHDLRHTTASWLVGQGVSLPMVGKLLGHTTTVTTARYAHLATDPVREALEKITAAMGSTAKPEVSK